MSLSSMPQTLRSLHAARLMRVLVLCATFMFCIAAQTAAAAETRLPEAQEARLRELSRDLRCLVCQNESLAESHAPLAGDLRDEIREQISAGQTDQEIIQYLVARYGDFVTYKPPFNTRTLFLWLGPFAVLLLLLTVLWSFHRRGRPSRRTALPEKDIREVHEAFRQLKRQYGNDDD